jgi:single-strand DNA-binding protein
MAEMITVTGNVGTEPEQRPLGNGEFVTSFRVGATHRVFDRNTQQWVDKYTNWYKVSAFRALGAHALASLHKGERVIVTGKLRVKDWNNGTKQGTDVEIDADAIGHDLLFGTTTYRRAGTSTSAGETAPVGAEAENTRASTDGDGWAIPAGEPALVPAAAGETPF